MCRVDPCGPPAAPPPGAVRPVKVGTRRRPSAAREAKPPAGTGRTTLLAERAVAHRGVMPTHDELPFAPISMPVAAKPMLVAAAPLPAGISVRAIRPTDAIELERFYATLSGESRRTRFLSLSPGLSHSLSVTFCTTDHDHREGFVAIAAAVPHGHPRIVGHLCLEPDPGNAAEVAIAVADDAQHQGVGRALAAAGVAWARRRGIGRLAATMFTANAPIQRLLLSLGLPGHSRCIGSGIAEVTLDLTGQVADSEAA